MLVIIGRTGPPRPSPLPRLRWLRRSMRARTRTRSRRSSGSASARRTPPVRIYGLYSYGLRSHGTCIKYGVCIVHAYAIFAYIVRRFFGSVSARRSPPAHRYGVHSYGLFGHGLYTFITCMADVLMDTNSSRAIFLTCEYGHNDSGDICISAITFHLGHCGSAKTDSDICCEHAATVG